MNATIDIDDCKAVTALAYLLVIDDREVWAPMSQVHGPANLHVNCGACEVEVSEWWAEREGLI